MLPTQLATHRSRHRPPVNHSTNFRGGAAEQRLVGARAMASWLKALAFGAGGIALVGMATLVAFQERLVYVPVLPGLARAYTVTPARFHLDYEDVWLRTSDGVRLHAWFLKHSSPVLALDHLSNRSDVDTSRIVIFGRSLGGAVGSVLALHNPDKASALVLENTFTSILDMAGVMLPFLKWVIGGSASKGPKVLNFLVRSPWSTIDVIGEIKQPILFLSGLQDELVPPVNMRMLYDKATEKNSQCLFVDFPDGMHMDTWFSGGDRYWRTIQLFLEQCIPQIRDNSKLNVNDHTENGIER